VELIIFFGAWTMSLFVL